MSPAELAHHIDEVRQLLQKYQALIALAAEPAATEAGAYARSRKLRKRALAEQFPGALRELDQLDAVALRARAASVERYLADLGAHPATARPPAWILWLLDFHKLTRALLALKAASTGQPLTVSDALPIVGPLCGSSDWLTQALLDRISSPRPGDRLVALVLGILSARHRVSPTLLRDTLFRA